MRSTAFSKFFEPTIQMSIFLLSIAFILVRVINFMKILIAGISKYVSKEQVSCEAINFVFWSKKEPKHKNANLNFI